MGPAVPAKQPACSLGHKLPQKVNPLQSPFQHQSTVRHVCNQVHAYKCSTDSSPSRPPPSSVLSPSSASGCLPFA